MGKLIANIQATVEGWLRKVCGRLTPGKRILIIAIVVGLFAVANIWITFSAIHSIGREDARRDVIKITPLEVPEFDLGGHSEQSELQLEIKDFFNNNFNIKENDTNDTEQGQAEK